MKILAVSQYYWPEPFNVSEICEELVTRGHSVTVLTGLPNYPEGEYYAGYNAKGPLEEVHNGVRILRVANKPRHTGSIARVVNYYSFAERGNAAARKLPREFDAVLAFTISPVMSAEPANTAAKHLGIPLVNYVIDLWPECLLAGGIQRDSPVFRHYRGVSRRIYGKADHFLVTSPGFIPYLSDLLKRDIDATFLPQFAEDSFFEDCETFAPEGYEAGKFNLTFAGNVGTAQAVDCIVRAASLADPTEALLFHIVGDGSELAHCKELAAELSCHNVVFHGRHDITEMPSYYAASDAMVASFADMPVLALTLPRKVQSYMAAGRPVIATAPGETKRVIEEAGCGSVCDPEDPDQLISACRNLAKTSEKERRAMGLRGREYCKENYARAGFFSTLERCLRETR